MYIWKNTTISTTKSRLSIKKTTIFRRYNHEQVKGMCMFLSHESQMSEFKPFLRLILERRVTRRGRFRLGLRLKNSMFVKKLTKKDINSD